MAKVGQPLIDIDVKDNEVEMDNLSGWLLLNWRIKFSVFIAYL